MNRLLWGIAFLVLAAAGGWAQSTWRGQAEVWAASSAPADGFVAASNQFPRNSLLTVENYKTKKTIQVRVVATLPADSSALVLLNAKAAQALDIKPGEAPMVGVQIDPTGADLAQNPDPDVNPLAAPPGAAPLAAAPSVAVPLAPLPVLAAPEAVPEPSAAPAPLAVTDEPDATPLTPGKKVFLTTRNSEPVTAETPVVAEPDAGTPAPVPPAMPIPAPVAAGPATAEAPAASPAAGATPATPLAPEPTSAPAPVASAPAAPAVTPTSAVSVPAVPVAVKPAAAWVNVPSALEGPVLGQVAFLATLDKGRPYVQVGAWATEADLLKTLETVKTYVPLALYKAEGEKNPWRVVASAPKGQLGVLLMLFRAQGFRSAALVKG